MKNNKIKYNKTEQKLTHRKGTKQTNQRAQKKGTRNKYGCRDPLILKLRNHIKIVN